MKCRRCKQPRQEFYLCDVPETGEKLLICTECLQEASVIGPRTELEKAESLNTDLSHLKAEEMTLE